MWKPCLHSIKFKISHRESETEKSAFKIPTFSHKLQNPCFSRNLFYFCLPLLTTQLSKNSEKSQFVEICGKVVAKIGRLWEKVGESVVI